MKALIQRVTHASVKVNGDVIGKIGKGLLILLGVKVGDTVTDAKNLASKTAKLRIFPDEQDKMHLSLHTISGEALVISQFTLYADTRKGNRPSFTQAAAPEDAERLYEHYVSELGKHLPSGHIQIGRFRASMQVYSINDGPVTIELTSET